MPSDEQRAAKADALEALAAGESPASGPAPDQTPADADVLDPPAAENPDGSLELVDESDESTELEAQVSLNAPGPVDRKKRARKFDRSQARHHAHTFRKTMIPLLLLSGLLLFILAGIVSATGKAEGDFRILVFAAFPLGALLIAGAVYFYFEVSRSQRGR